MTPSAERTTGLIHTIQHSRPGSPAVNAAVAELVDGYRTYVTSRHAGWSIDREEIDSIAAVAIWQAAQRFNVDRASPNGFGSLAFELTRRRIIDELRKQGRRPPSHELADGDGPTADHDRLAEMVAEEKAQQLRRKLTPTEEAVFDARRRGHSFAEIAAALNRTIKCIDNAAVRIRSKFAAMGGLALA